MAWSVFSRFADGNLETATNSSIRRRGELIGLHDVE
jgi:hypothetical protein